MGFSGDEIYCRVRPGKKELIGFEKFDSIWVGNLGIQILNPEPSVGLPIDEIWFLPWANTLERVSRLGWFPNNSNVLIYEGPPSLAGVTPEQTKKSIDSLYRSVESYLYYDSRKTPISLLGISVGTSLASYLPGRLERKISKLGLFVPGARLGENIFNGVMTRDVRERVIEEGINFPEEYDLRMGNYNPIHNVQNFPIGKTSIEIGENDTAIGPGGLELARVAKSVGVAPFVKLHRGGHVQTIITCGILYKLNMLNYNN